MKCEYFLEASQQPDDGIIYGLFKPVGEEERALLAGEIQRLLDQILRLGVHRRGGLVQDQDARVGQDGPRQRQPLLLCEGAFFFRMKVR